jgi:putative Holliday junction resolvase
MTGRALGLDPGERRIGVAVSDVSRTIASPVRFIDTKTEDVTQTLRDICDEYEITVVVVGLPISLDGSEGRSAQAARDFGDLVNEATDMTVEFQDERFTSRTAEAALIEGGVSRKSRKEKRDQVAAALMLQSFLDRKSHDANDE